MNSKIFRRFVNRVSIERGASSVEYATLLSLIAIFLLTGVSSLGNAADRKLSAVSSALSSHNHNDAIGRFGGTSTGDQNPGGLPTPSGGGTTEMGPGPGGTIDSGQFGIPTIPPQSHEGFGQ